MDKNGNPGITTQRLQLRAYTPQISNHLFGAYSDFELLKYYGFKSIEELQIEKERYHQGLVMFGKSFYYFHLILKDSGEVIGWCGFHTIYTRHARAELGYVMTNDFYKGKGYMKEALRPVLQFGFENLNLHRIEAFIASDNIPSFKLLTGHGFVKEGLLREHYFTNNRHEDSLIYSLLKKEFQVSHLSTQK